MIYEQALSIVNNTIQEVDVEAAYEIDNFFIFDLKTKGAPSGISTGLLNVAVNKKTKEVTSVLPGDPILKRNSLFKIVK